MAAVADSNSSHAPYHALAAKAQALFLGLLWGAVMLGVFGFWIRSKYEGSQATLTNIFLLAGVAAAGLAIWQAFTLWFKNETPDQKAATLGQQQRLLSYVLLAGGIGLIVLAFVLGVGKRGGANYAFIPDNFAESFGVLLFGLIALVGGYLLQLPPAADISPIQFLIGKLPLLKLVMLIVGVAAIGSFGYLFVTRRQEFATWYPELVALLFTSMLAFGCLLWLNTGEFDEFGVRLFVLVFGGAWGLILFLYALGRGYIWRQDIILGGAAAWQGENAWRFWLCAYLLFVSLVLMFVSFNLARADIRKQIVLRRVMYGYDAVVQALLLAGILTILNIVVYALVPFSFDWTKSRGAYALSEASKNLIAGLKQETNIFVLIPQNSYVYKDVRILLENCQALNSRLKVEYISPDLDDQKYEELAKLFPKLMPENPMAGAGRGVLIVNGPIPVKGEGNTTPNAFIGEKKLFEIDSMAARRGEKAKSTFKGETEILKELKFLVQGQKQNKIYVLQGNGELDLNNKEGTDRVDPRNDFAPVGMGFLVERLTTDNFDVVGLTFGTEIPGLPTPPNIVFAKSEGKDKRKEIPADCHTLMIAGVSKDYPKETLDAVESYLNRQGKLLVFLDVLVETDFSKMRVTNLEGLLKQFGVEVTNDVLLRFTVDPRDDPRVLFATTTLKSENPLAKQFTGKRINMKRSARLVQPAEGPGGFKAEVILNQELVDDRRVIMQKSGKALADPLGFMADVRTDPIKFNQFVHKKATPLAVAVSAGDKPRMVVFGDTDFITNREIMLSQTRVVNYDFIVSSLEWMSEREGMVGTQPKVTQNFMLDAEVDYWRMVLLPGWLMLLTLLGLGIGVWVVRRR